MRASGILLPVASLPSKYGIGSFSKEAFEFIDMLHEAGQRFWQILPLGLTGYGDSPYQSFSTFAGNAYFIDLETLVEEGLLTVEECESYDFGDDVSYIDYGKIYNSRYIILRKAYERSKSKSDKAFKKFQEKHSFWLEDFSLYMAVKNHFQGVSWSEWDQDIKLREPEAIEYYKDILADDIKFQEFIQYLFEKQWNRVKNYANSKGVKIIGDIPIYVAFDSADTWSHPELFQLDKNRNPIAVSGCPPDGFSVTGQLWGNPLYDWEKHKKTDYEWWIQRITHCFEIYDVVRVDHFRGFDEYYSIPFGELTAEFGEWKTGPSYDLFQAIYKKLGKVDIIAEDLGYLTDSVKELVKKTDYPGMKVLEFAFDSREESDYLPHNYDKNCVVYTGTHDNDTIQGWYEMISSKDREFSKKYLNNYHTKKEDIHWDFIRLAMGSVADLCIIPIQDYLGLGKEARINIPSTLGNNWKWRLTRNEIDRNLIKKIQDITKVYGRL